MMVVVVVGAGGGACIGATTPRLKIPNIPYKNVILHTCQQYAISQGT